MSEHPTQVDLADQTKVVTYGNGSNEIISSSLAAGYRPDGVELTADSDRRIDMGSGNDRATITGDRNSIRQGPEENTPGLNGYVTTDNDTLELGAAGNNKFVPQNNIIHQGAGDDKTILNDVRSNGNIIDGGTGYDVVKVEKGSKTDYTIAAAANGGVTLTHKETGNTNTFRNFEALEFRRNTSDLSETTAPVIKLVDGNGKPVDIAKIQEQMAPVQKQMQGTITSTNTTPVPGNFDLRSPSQNMAPAANLPDISR